MTPVKTRQKIERLIVETLIKDALAAGYAINVNNGGDTEELPKPSTNTDVILKKMFATDEESLIMYKDHFAYGWVSLVYGNDGWDVICNYTTNLEHIMGGAFSEADKWSD